MALESRKWRAVLGTFLSALLVVPFATVGAQPADVRNAPALIVFEALGVVAHRPRSPVMRRSHWRPYAPTLRCGWVGAPRRRGVPDSALG